MGTRLQDLPIELLTQCSSHLETPDVQNIRLVSKRCYEASSSLLIQFIRVYISSQSLAQLEEVCRHSIYSKSVNCVEFNVSFYDTALAHDKVLFAKCCAGDLYRVAEINERVQFFRMNRGGAYQDEDGTARIWEIQKHWQGVRGESSAENNPDQALLRELHRTYSRLCDDQEFVKQDGAHMGRIGEALSKLPRLREIVVRDRDCRSNWSFETIWRSISGDLEPVSLPVFHSNRNQRERPSKEKNWFPDAGIANSCLRALPWKGNFVYADVHAAVGRPPAELLFGLLETLDSHRIIPAAVDLDITPPYDLSALASTQEARLQVSNVLQQASSLSITVSTWARADSLALDNSRPYGEINHLGLLTTAFFNVECLQSLTLSFDNYPVFYETPQISICDLLPARKWPSLQTLSLHHIPLHQSELAELVDRQHDTITDLAMYGLFLLSGTWADSVELLRGFEKLTKISFKYPVGGAFQNRRGSNAEYPKEAVETYILHGGPQNPMRGRG